MPFDQFLRQLHAGGSTGLNPLSQFREMVEPIIESEIKHYR
jgi:hypothetical protein